MARKRSLRTDGAGSLILGQFVIVSIASLQISRQPNLFNLADDFSGRRRHVLVAVAEHAAERGAEVKYSTVQNWYPGDREGKGGIFNFVTKRGICKGDDSKISWTQVETG